MADFILGRLKFKWRGDWTVSTAYIKDDIVKYGANTYVALVNHTSSATIPGFYTNFQSNGYWGLHSEGQAFKDEWTTSTHYKLNDIVKFGSQQYRCTTQHTSSGTSLNTANFVVWNEGIQFENTWSSAIYYQDGDVVTYGGYSYIAKINHTNQLPSTPASIYWEVLTTGFKALGDYNAGTNYKTGDTINFGGWSYVAILDASAGAAPSNSPANWQVINEGFKWMGTYSASTTYYKGHTVEYTSSTWVAIAHTVYNITPGSDPTKWQLMSQGDSSAVMTLRGDMIVRNASAAARLPLGPLNSKLISNGSDPIWSSASADNIIYVSNSGSDTLNNGKEGTPFRTINHALNQANKAGVLSINTPSGGTGGAAGIYRVTTTTSSGSGTSLQVYVTTNGSTPPTVDDVIIENGGNSHATGDTITILGTALGNSSNLTFTVRTASIGDYVSVQDGVYREILPLRIPEKVNLTGGSLRGTVLAPATGNSTQIATINNVTGGTGGTAGTYKYLHPTASANGKGCVVTVVKAGGAPTVTLYHGGCHYIVGETLTIPNSSLGGGTNLTFQVASLELNSAANMLLTNDGNNITYFSFRELTGEPVGGGYDYHGRKRAHVISLDPSGSISDRSPYLKDCSALCANNAGITIDGALHLPAGYVTGQTITSNRSILANDFTQINNDGIGVWALNKGRGEMVSVFTYYCDTSYLATGGGFLRTLGGSGCYGEYGALATGGDEFEVPKTCFSRGSTIEFVSTSFSGGSNDENMLAVGDQLLGLTSGATAQIFFLQTSAKLIYITNITGNFLKAETVRATKVNSTQYEFNLNTLYGQVATSNASYGVQGYLVPIYSTNSLLSASGVLKLGSNIKFAANPTYYRLTAVTNESLVNQQAVVRINPALAPSTQLVPNTAIEITSEFSNIRMTAHDFLDIGTGDFITTNYPNTPSQLPDSEDEVVQLLGGRVYFTATDQNGDFKVGGLFKVEQATGSATLNADAFNLSGLSELQLGAIGASLGATINEFSTDETMAGDSNTAVPVEVAIVGYTQRQNMGVGHFTPPIGTTAQRPTAPNLYQGGLRFSTTRNTWEGWNGSNWTGLAGGLPWVTLSGLGATPTTVTSGYRAFVNTLSAASIVNLPANPDIGDEIRLIDLAGTFATNNLTIQRNTKLIMGLAENFTISTDNAAVGLIYTGATYGWKLNENV